jgi:hypothetical protein
MCWLKHDMTPAHFKGPSLSNVSQRQCPLVYADQRRVGARMDGLLQNDVLIGQIPGIMQYLAFWRCSLTRMNVSDHSVLQPLFLPISHFSSKAATLL